MDVVVLDLGSSSFHLLHARVWADGSIVRVETQREPVALAGVVSSRGRLDAAAWDRATEAVAKLADIIAAIAPERVIAAATHALRAAENGPMFIDMVRRQHGIDVELLSPAEEARATFLGARSEFSPAFGRIAVADLGGGSLELAVGEVEPASYSVSLPLGVGLVREAICPDRLFRDTDLPELRERLRSALVPAARAARAHAPGWFVLASGCARAVRALAAELGFVTPARRLVSREALCATAESAARSSRAMLTRLGVRADRVDTIAIAAAIFEALLELFGCDEAWVARRGLREGLVVRAQRGERGEARDRLCASA